MTDRKKTEDEIRQNYTLVRNALFKNGERVVEQQKQRVDNCMISNLHIRKVLRGGKLPPLKGYDFCDICGGSLSEEKKMTVANHRRCWHNWVVEYRKNNRRKGGEAE